MTDKHFKTCGKQGKYPTTFFNKKKQITINNFIASLKLTIKTTSKNLSKNKLISFEDL
jgi:hypothetical protein